MNKDIRPNKSEILFLTLSYNRFYDIFDEVFSDDFWNKDKFYRFSIIKDAFSIYSEILLYEPINWIIDSIRLKRPPMEAEISKELFKFIRNVLLHFPFFRSWDEVWINNDIINWHKKDQSIDKFLNKYKGNHSIKYRFWESNKKKMTYLSINFPEKYNSENIYLRDILSEKEGVKFSLILMRQILDTQVEK